jgi:hypothetical protein
MSRDPSFGVVRASFGSGRRPESHGFNDGWCEDKCSLCSDGDDDYCEDKDNKC